MWVWDVKTVKEKEMCNEAVGINKEIEMMNVEKRMAIERKVVRKLVREMKKGGWDAYGVNDGEALVRCNKEADVMDAVFSVDESVIKFKKYLADGAVIKRSAVIVLGNDGYDAIADCSVSNPEIPDDNFDAVMDGPVSAYCDKLEEEVFG